MNSFEAINSAVAADPERQSTIWIGEDGSRTPLTAQQLHARAMARAHALQSLGLRRDDLMLIALEYSLDLPVTFLAGVYGAAIPAVLAYHTDRTDAQAYAERVQRMATASAARAVVCDDDVAAALAPLLGDDCRIIALSELQQGDRQAPWQPPASVGDDSLAFVQFTSGTTGIQKGVQITHRALLDFVPAKSKVVRPTREDVIISWLPLFHDMGLMTGLFMPMIEKFCVVQMSPRYWVRSPVQLLRLAHEYRGTLCWMPNFAFSLITRRVRDADLAGLDLSSFRMIIDGAEMARQDSIAGFVERLVPYGLRRDALCSGYGMAEMVLTTSIGRLRIDWIDAATLRQTGRAVPETARAPGAISVVSSGPPIDGIEFAICDASGQHLPERHLGEILVRSNVRFNGYWRRPDLTAAAMMDDWFCSGDLGYFAEGEIFICGRKKDLIIVGGNNIHPEDVEAIAERVPGVQPGRAVSFGVADPQLGTERIILLCELREPPPEIDTREVDRALRRAVLRELDVTIGELRFVPRGWIIKTTSGKHARSANRDKYLAERAEPAS